MSDDDSRELETPDRTKSTRADEDTTNDTDTTTNTAHHTDTDRGSYSDRLETIDRTARRLLEDVRADESLETRVVARHLREICAEVECIERELRSDADVPMVRRSGSGTRSALGPEPAAFERWERDRTEGEENGE
ncbi:hypothetical protein [Halostagnicola sp. A-GB9-2]|uniref:hypothetical protein n=1 Tax=Halostagnicola sp. A-GB9-2 TaxID=3048066 RepID=UPI0024BFF665|nr:hypothetical protein [Halostagnicola sp. A-GB9-2]MDJ1431993.1 hypothetical protein [Halostagnicola sp. A-GB9-2]